jgi:hypothetical protein
MMKRLPIIARLLACVAAGMAAMMAVAADTETRKSPQLLAQAKEIVALNQASVFVQAMSPAAALAGKGRSLPADLDPAAKAAIDRAAARIRDLTEPVAINVFAEKLVDDLSAEDIGAIAAFMRTDDGKAIATAFGQMAENPVTNLNAAFSPDPDFAKEIAALAAQAGLKTPKNWEFPASSEK